MFYFCSGSALTLHLTLCFSPPHPYNLLIWLHTYINIQCAALYLAHTCSRFALIQHLYWQFYPLNTESVTIKREFLHLCKRNWCCKRHSPSVFLSWPSFIIRTYIGIVGGHSISQADLHIWICIYDQISCQVSPRVWNKHGPALRK